MFILSRERSAGAIAILYGEIAELTKRMDLYYKNPRYPLTFSRQLAWKQFEFLLRVMEDQFKTKKQFHGEKVKLPDVTICTSGLSMGELGTVELDISQKIELALTIHKGMMSLCEDLNKKVKSGHSPDLHSARRQAQRWCEQSNKEYLKEKRKLQPRQILAKVTCHPGSHCYMGEPAGAW